MECQPTQSCLSPSLSPPQVPGPLGPVGLCLECQKPGPPPPGEEGLARRPVRAASFCSPSRLLCSAPAGVWPLVPRSASPHNCSACHPVVTGAEPESPERKHSCGGGGARSPPPNTHPAEVVGAACGLPQPDLSTMGAGSVLGGDPIPRLPCHLRPRWLGDGSCLPSVPCHHILVLPLN